MPGMKALEKRRAPRKLHDSVVEIFDDAGQHITDVARLVDVSTVGASFTSTKVILKGAKLRLRLRLLQEGRLYISGRVVWVRNKVNFIQYGFAFDSVHEVA